ncbi:MAG: response regulator [Pirellulaceae bacterium]
MQKVLDVGQCGPDHARIAHLLRQHFDVEVHQAESVDEAIQQIDASPWDLILLNRVFDATGSHGLEMLRSLKSNESTARIPVMLVSNFPDAQTEAVSAGAVQGFGKASLNAPGTLEALRRALGDA